MKPRRPAAVLFDCDGVLIDSEGPTQILLQQDLARHGLILSRSEIEQDYLGATVEDLAPRARAAGARLPDDWVARFYDRMEAMLAAEAPLMPGAAALLDRLEGAGLPFAVASNGSERKMQITLGRHGLIPRFRAVLSGQALGRPKPAPEVYLAAAAACGAAPADCVVVEDSPTGARAGLAAGARVIGLAPHGPDTPPARNLAALGVPLIPHLDALAPLLAL
jgi:HAD superfamily hydrolase (TIGR01509 family)